jgi:DNA modification methylase
VDSPTWQILAGDCRDSLASLEPGSARTCVTSPPYFGLRDYGHDGQIGAERNLLEYTTALRSVFHEVRRVLADDGTLWLNLGDSYDKRKSLIGVPWKMAQHLKNDGWTLRSEIIWAKPDPMPESVSDRPTKAHEHIFLLAKSPRYYYDAAAIREEQAGEFLSSGARNPRFGRVGGLLPSEAAGDLSPKMAARDERRNATMARFTGQPEDGGRNRRSVWTVAKQPFPGAHFATFPPKLIEPCILAGSREGDTVLDPFVGSGTTGMVALRHGRSFIGCELNNDYVRLARDRIIADSPLLNTHAEAA